MCVVCSVLRTTIDKESARHSDLSGIGSDSPAASRLQLDGAAIRIEPVGGSELREDGGLLVIPASGMPLTAAAVRELIDADRYGR
jgi:hypothetical protein